MNTTVKHLAIVAVLALPLAASRAEIAQTTLDFGAPLPWGHGSCVMKWDRTPASLRARGEDGMSEKSGEYFAVIDAGLWTPMGDNPYIRSLVSQTIWPLGTVVTEDVGKTVKFSALFGWHGGEPARARDIVVAKHTGFSLDQEGTGPGLDGGVEFAFDSVNEREWGEVSSTYTIKPEDVGQELNVNVAVMSKQETADGLPVIATSDWKIEVTE